MMENCFRPLDLPPAILTGFTGNGDEPVALELRVAEILWPGMESITWNSRLQYPGVSLDISVEASTGHVSAVYRLLVEIRQSGEVPVTPFNLGAISARFFVPRLKARDLLGVYGTIRPVTSLKEIPTDRSPIDRKAMYFTESYLYPFSMDFAFLSHTVDPPELDIFIEGLAAQVRALYELRAEQGL